MHWEVRGDGHLGGMGEASMGGARVAYFMSLELVQDKVFLHMAPHLDGPLLIPHIASNGR